LRCRWSHLIATSRRLNRLRSDKRVAGRCDLAKAAREPTLGKTRTSQSTARVRGAGAAQ
jgi:hypothetical protein